MSKKRKELEEAVLQQEEWIQEHGGTLDAYIKCYGDPGLDRCIGIGGTAIFAADMAELRRVKQRLLEAIQQEMKKKSTSFAAIVYFKQGTTQEQVQEEIEKIKKNKLVSDVFSDGYDPNYGAPVWYIP